MYSIQGFIYFIHFIYLFGSRIPDEDAGVFYTAGHHQILYSRVQQFTRKGIGVHKFVDDLIDLAPNFYNKQKDEFIRLQYSSEFMTIIQAFKRFSQKDV